MKKVHSKKNFILSVLIILGLTVVIAMACLLMLFLSEASQELISMTPNSDVAYMRDPLLIMSWSIIVLFILACVLAIIFIIVIMRGGVYTSRSIKLIKYMALLFYLMLIPAISMILYIFSNIGLDISVVYLGIGVVLAIVIGSIFLLFAGLIQEGSRYKEENELTI